MAFTFTITSLVALASLSGSAFAAPAQNIGARAACAKTIYTKSGDNCDTIAAANGLTANDIKTANDFVTCNDIWPNTPICIVAATTPTCSSTYSSKSGDTCDTLATKFGVTSDAIHAANSFLTCNDIWPNTPICVPASATPTCASTYVSVSGDNCDTIDNKFGLSAGSIKAANAFVTCNDIWPNTSLCVPPGGSSNGGTSDNGGSTTSNCVMTYISEAGDTCDSLGNDFGLSGSAIQSSNSFLNCNDIWANTAICVPAGGRVSTPQAGSASDCVVTYRSTGGDNCDVIGNKFGLEAWEIQNANSFVNCNDIWSGTALCIVSGCS